MRALNQITFTGINRYKYLFVSEMGKQLAVQVERDVRFGGAYASEMGIQKSVLQGITVFWIWGWAVSSWLAAKVLRHHLVCAELGAFSCVHTSDLVQLPGNQLF